MAELRAASEGMAGQSYPTGPGGTGAGVDVVAELERVRSNLLALALVVEEVRSRHNGHTHGGTAPLPPAGEQAATPFTVQ